MNSRMKGPRRWAEDAALRACPASRAMLFYREDIERLLPKAFKAGRASAAPTPPPGQTKP